jgi:transcriptional regulator with XRE-family HTH domain
MKPEIQHMLTVLKTAMRVLGFSNRDIERKLGLSSSYLSRLFSGVIELRFEHVVEIAKAMGLELDEVLYFAYPYPKHPPSAAATRLREMMGSFQVAKGAPAPPAEPRPAGSPLSEEEMERMMARTLRKLFGELARVDKE